MIQASAVDALNGVEDLEEYALDQRVLSPERQLSRLGISFIGLTGQAATRAQVHDHVRVISLHDEVVEEDDTIVLGGQVVQPGLPPWARVLTRAGENLDSDGGGEKRVDDVVSFTRRGVRRSTSGEGGAVDDAEGTGSKLFDELETALVDGATSKVGDGGALLRHSHDGRSDGE